MEPAEPVQSSTTEARSRQKWLITELFDELRELNVIELDEVQR